MESTDTKTGETTAIVRRIPLALLLSRLLLGPVLLAIAFSSARPDLASGWVLAGVWYATVSDIIDGMIARRLGVATAMLRRMDGWVDTVFWLFALAATWRLFPDVCQSSAGIFAAFIVMEAFTYVLSVSRFGREHSNHAYSAKLWGILLVTVFTAVLGFGQGHSAFLVLFVGYTVCWLDTCAIILILPCWHTDVPSFYHAWLIRRGVPFRRNPLFHSEHPPERPIRS